MLRTSSLVMGVFQPGRQRQAREGGRARNGRPVQRRGLGGGGGLTAGEPVFVEVQDSSDPAVSVFSLRRRCESAYRVSHPVPPGCRPVLENRTFGQVVISELFPFLSGPHFIKAAFHSIHPVGVGWQGSPIDLHPSLIVDLWLGAPRQRRVLPPDPPPNPSGPLRATSIGMGWLRVCFAVARRLLRLLRWVRPTYVAGCKPSPTASRGPDLRQLLQLDLRWVPLEVVVDHAAAVA